MLKRQSRYWWAEHLPIKEELGGVSYRRTKFQQGTVYCGKQYNYYVDESEREIDPCDSTYSNFGFQKKRLFPKEILCCDRRKITQNKLQLSKVVYYGRVVECGTLNTLTKFFPAFTILTFKAMQRNGFIPPPNIVVGKHKYYFFEHLCAFAKVYNDLVLQGVFHPTPTANYLHHAWLLQEWERATKKIYDKPMKQEMDELEAIPYKERNKKLQEVIWE